ncbi:hypothetical protein ACQ4PT_052370 [Festuca glaucescens]
MHKWLLQDMFHHGDCSLYFPDDAKAIVHVPARPMRARRGQLRRGDCSLFFPTTPKLTVMRYLQDRCRLDMDSYVAALSAERDRHRDELTDDDTAEDEDRALLLDSSFILVASIMLSKMGVGEDADSAGAARAASINRKYLILHMVLAQHVEQIKLDMLVLENLILFAAVKLLVASRSRLKLRHSVEQVVLGCFDDVYSISTPLKLIKIKESERLFPCSLELRHSAVWFRPASASAETDSRDAKATPACRSVAARRAPLDEQPVFPRP